MTQRFIGSSQRGIHSLEARVHGLELALDEISFDLAFSNGRMSRDDPSCCSLPGAEFLNSKLWRKTQPRTPAFQLSGKNEDGEGLQLQTQRARGGGGRGLTVNPLARIPLPEVSSNAIVV